MDVPYDTIVSWLEVNQDFIDYVKAHYSYEYEYYCRYRQTKGPKCPIARAAAKRIFVLELGRDSAHILACVESGTFRTNRGNS